MQLWLYRFDGLIGGLGKLYRLAPALLIPVTLACSEGKAADNHIDGPTDSRFLKKLESARSEGFDRVIVSSFGGPEAEALDIAEFIRNNDISITVDGYCTSSCAQYLLPAAKHVTILNNSLVSFHVNSYGLRDLSIPDKKSAAIIRYNSERAVKLYNDEKVSLQLMELATRMMDLQCIDSMASQNGKVFGLYDVWVPTKEFLTNSGLEFDGFWPKDGIEASKLAKSLLGSKVRVRYGGVVEGGISPAYQDLPAC